MKLFVLGILAISGFHSTLILVSSICPSGYTADASNMNCYLFANNNMTVEQAQDFCQSQTPPSNLPIFKTSNEFTDLVILKYYGFF